MEIVEILDLQSIRSSPAQVMGSGWLCRINLVGTRTWIMQNKQTRIPSLIDPLMDNLMDSLMDPFMDPLMDLLILLFPT